MNQDTVIAKLSTRVLELEEKLADIKEMAGSARVTLICIGGPFNDNSRKFTSEQLHELAPVLDHLNDICELFSLEDC